MKNGRKKLVFKSILSAAINTIITGRRDTKSTFIPMNILMGNPTDKKPEIVKIILVINKQTSKTKLIPSNLLFFGSEHESSSTIVYLQKKGMGYAMMYLYPLPSA